MGTTSGHGEGRVAASASDRPPVAGPSPVRILQGAAVGVGLIWLPILLLWSGAPFALTFDDAYYYFEIARNVAAGEGSSFDGLTSTNGYHPLWLLMSVPVYAAGLDSLVAVRALLVAQLVMWVATLMVLAGTVGRAIDGWPRLAAPDRAGAARLATGAVALALVVVGANPYVLKLFVNGLESGPAALVGALLLARAVADGGRFLEGPSSRRLVTGLLLGLAVLARTDAVLLVGVIALWSWTDWWGAARRVRSAAELLGPPSVVLGLYLLSNRVLFDTWTQVSGDVKRLDLTGGRLAALAVVGALAIGLLVATRRRRDLVSRSRVARAATVARRTGWYASFCLLLVGYYVVLSAQQWLWYFAPLVLYATLLLLLLVADLAEGAVVEAPTRRPARAMAPVLAIVLLPLVAGLAFQARSVADPHQRSIQEANREAGRWIDEQLPSDAVLGSWDAGVVGYFTDRPVVNLDGVVNDAAWAAATQPSERAERLAQLDVRWIVNHGPVVDGADPNIDAAARELLPEGATLEVVHQVPFRYSGTTTQDGSAGLKDMAVYVYRVS